MLKSFLFKRPDWFKHEGYWRLVQVLRIGLPALFILWGILAIVIDQAIKFGITVIVIGLAVLVALHILVRVAAWIKEGFESSGK